MRRFLVVSMVLMMALVIAAPTFALEVKWGGLWRTRLISQHDFVENFAGAGNGMETDQGSSVPYRHHVNRIDQRLRMYIDFISSENLRVHTKFETNANWGAVGKTSSSGTNNAINSAGSGNIGADSGPLVVKNAYLDFKIPQTPLQAKIGVQTITLIDSWVVDDDFSAALLNANLKPFTVTLGYIAGYNENDMIDDENIDDLVAIVSYKEGPFSALLLGLWQDGHSTGGSIYPMTQSTPFRATNNNVNTPTTMLTNPFTGVSQYVSNNQLFDLGFQLGYKLDFLSAYLNFVKNFGSVKMGTTLDNKKSKNYTGWMVDGGFNYFCAPWSWNIGGFYTTGTKFEKVEGASTATFEQARRAYDQKANSDIDWFTYPMSGPSKVFSEIIGGGIFDNYIPNGGYWRGYPSPTNIWTVTAGGAWQVLPQTKLALSWYYFGTTEKVPSRWNTDGTVKFDNYLGNEIDLNITQNIVDKLNLDLVGAYMFAGDAYRFKNANSPNNHTDAVYELGARLQWTW